jgi:hypothetical protein
MLYFGSQLPQNVHRQDLTQRVNLFDGRGEGCFFRFDDSPGDGHDGGRRVVFMGPDKQKNRTCDGIISFLGAIRDGV